MEGRKSKYERDQGGPRAGAYRLTLPKLLSHSQGDGDDLRGSLAQEPMES